MSAKLTGLVSFVFVAVSIGVFVGCGNSVPSMRDLNDNNLRRLHSAYKIYMNRHEMTGPQSEDELKDFLKTNQTAKVLLGRMGVESVDDIFISERDGKPFKVRWGVEGLADHAIVFEQEGVDGKRMVAFTRTRELEADEYEGYWTGTLKGDKPGGRINDRAKEKAE